MDTLFLTQKRKVTAQWHLQQVIKWLEFDDKRHLDNVLVYASFELRCAIERILIENILIMKDGKLNEAEEKKCESKNGMMELMKIAEPNYRKRADFTNIILSKYPGKPKVIILDVKYLIRNWHKLSTYCHKQLKPEESFESAGRDFQKKGFTLIESIIETLKKWSADRPLGLIQPTSMPQEVREVFDLYVQGKISENQAKIRLKLMDSVLEIRKGFLGGLIIRP